MQVEIAIKLRGTVYCDDQTGLHVGYCPALDIYSQGTSEEEAHQALTDAMIVYVRLCYERGILDNILNGRGFRPVAPGVAADGPGAPERETISVRPCMEFDFAVPLHLESAMLAQHTGSDAWQA